jgi:N-acyl-D-aspartate/D-glutamate deacylase
LISGARVVDGGGGKSRFVDVAVDRERIVDLGECRDWRADTSIDAAGLVLAPGFIDSHTHDDLAVLETPDLVCKLSQGVTTVIAGNCGISLAPLRPGATLPPPFPLLGEVRTFQYPSVQAYRDALSRAPGAVNLALLTGHSSLRLDTMPGRLDQAADSASIAVMRDKLKLALQQGSIGLSTGLDYPPAQAATTEEVLQLASVLHEFEAAVYATHMRDEGDRVTDAVAETLDIGERARVPVIISHHKCAGPANYGRSRETLAMIDRARSHRQAVSLDVYPYTASATSLLPHFIRDAESVLIADSTPHPECNGRMLDRVAADWGCSLDETCERLYPASAIYFQIDEQDLQRIMTHPAAMIGSDGIASMRTPHPRLWGTFPRVLGHYVREKKLFDLETAVHKMTGLTASRFGLTGRGRIEIGHFADLVLFDADTILDRASFDDPAQLSEGIVGVWVNGEPAWRDNAPGGRRNGRFLSHAG